MLHSEICICQLTWFNPVFDVVQIVHVVNLRVGDALRVLVQPHADLDGEEEEHEAEDDEDHADQHDGADLGQI